MAWAQVKKPYADYDLRPRPTAWAQVINSGTEPQVQTGSAEVTRMRIRFAAVFADHDPCPRPMAWARVKNHGGS